MTSARAAALKAAYEDGLADFDQHTAILHPEVEWQTNWPGLAPAVHGVEGLRRWVEEFMGPWEWVRFDVREVIEVDEETVFVWNRARARKGERCRRRDAISTTCSRSAMDESCCGRRGPIAPPL